MSAPTHDDATWAALVDAASAPYRGSGRFAWGFARGKLGRDPVFRHLLRQGLIAPGSRVLDIGCGQGLLASLLRAAEQRAAAGLWPADWAAAPAGVQVHGIELVPQEVERARAALGAGAEVVCGDMRHTAFGAADVVVILDVLHYVPIDDQNAVLQRVCQALRRGGQLLLRVGDAASPLGYRAAWCVDAIVALARWGRVAPMYGRTLAQWTAHLQGLGFQVATRPMSTGTPFANVLMQARWVGPGALPHESPAGHGPHQTAPRPSAAFRLGRSAPRPRPAWAFSNRPL